MFIDVRDRLKLAGRMTGFADQPSGRADIVLYHPQGPGWMSGGINPRLKPGERRGREYIIVDEWGPYDWKSPKLWPVLGDAGPLPFRRRATPEGLFDGPVKLNVLVAPARVE